MAGRSFDKTADPVDPLATVAAAARAAAEEYDNGHALGIVDEMSDALVNIAPCPAPNTCCRVASGPFDGAAEWRL